MDRYEQAYVELQKQGATKEELQFFTDNKEIIRVGTSKVRLDILRILIDYGIKNIKYCASLFIDYDDDGCALVIANYNYAKSTFKNKPRCIGYYIAAFKKKQLI